MLQIIRSRANKCNSCNPESLLKDLNSVYKDIAADSMRYFRNNIYGLKNSISNKDIIFYIFKVTFLQNKLNTICKGSSLRINICTPVETEPCQY